LQGTLSWKHFSRHLGTFYIGFVFIFLHHSNGRLWKNRGLPLVTQGRCSAAVWIAFKDLDEDAKVLLVDDVTTSGGHLQACAAKLESEGLAVDLVVCAGKTIYDQDNPAFHTYEYKLDTYEP
jgi:hypothetical protein